MPCNTGFPPPASMHDHATLPQPELSTIGIMNSTNTTVTATGFIFSNARDWWIFFALAAVGWTVVACVLRQSLHDARERERRA